MDIHERVKIRREWEEAAEACLAMIGELNTSMEAVKAAYAPWLAAGAPPEGPFAESFFGTCERSVQAEQAYDEQRSVYDKALQLLLTASGQSLIARRAARPS